MISRPRVVITGPCCGSPGECDDRECMRRKRWLEEQEEEELRKLEEEEAKECKA